jgi:hypothetical protein
LITSQGFGAISNMGTKLVSTSYPLCWFESLTVGYQNQILVTAIGHAEHELFFPEKENILNV